MDLYELFDLVQSFSLLGIFFSCFVLAIFVVLKER